MDLLYMDIACLKNWVWSKITHYNSLELVEIRVRLVDYNKYCNVGCVWFDVNRIPSVKWMQGKVNSHKENEIQVFGSAMENSLENDL